MIVVFDASVLVFLFEPSALAPDDPATGQPVTRCHDRVAFLLNELQRAKAKIIVPAPALAEILVYGSAASPEWLRILSTSKHFRISPFDQIAAIECAALTRERLARGPKLTGVERRKAKFDEQIVAIATVEQADVIFSDDSDIRKLAAGKTDVRGIAALGLPPEERQQMLQFEPLEEEPEGPTIESE